MDIISIKEHLVAEIANILELEETEITDQSDFVEDLGMDSLQALELMVSLEKKFRISFPEEALGQFTNIQSVVHAMQALG